MRAYGIVLAGVLLAGCGGDAPEPVPASQPKPFRTVIESEGIPFEISWDRGDRTRATARVFGAPPDVTIDPSNIVAQATGCSVIGVPVRVAADDDVPTFSVATNCAPAEVRDVQEAALSRELAREIDLALTLVAQQRAPVAASVQSAPLSAPSLFEGSPFSAFDASDIERYCAERWETRVAPDGRTEYNPCRRREVFR
ncbi:MAG: hypothetical protein AAF637_14935 [Pseudomonadota bacterium]